MAKPIPFSATQPAGVDLSDDGSRQYVGCVSPAGQGRVYIIETSGDTVVDSLTAGGNLMGYIITPPTSNDTGGMFAVIPSAVRRTFNNFHVAVRGEIP